MCFELDPIVIRAGIALDEIRPPAYSDLSSISETGSDSEDTQTDVEERPLPERARWRSFSLPDTAIYAGRQRFHHWCVRACPLGCFCALHLQAKCRFCLVLIVCVLVAVVLFAGNRFAIIGRYGHVHYESCMILFINYRLTLRGQRYCCNYS